MITLLATEIRNILLIAQKRIQLEEVILKILSILSSLALSAAFLFVSPSAKAEGGATWVDQVTGLSFRVIPGAFRWDTAEVLCQQKFGAEWQLPSCEEDLNLFERFFLSDLGTSLPASDFTDDWDGIQMTDARAFWLRNEDHCQPGRAFWLNLVAVAGDVIDWGSSDHQDEPLGRYDMHGYKDYRSSRLSEVCVKEPGL